MLEIKADLTALIRVGLLIGAGKELALLERAHGLFNRLPLTHKELFELARLTPRSLCKTVLCFDGARIGLRLEARPERRHQIGGVLADARLNPTAWSACAAGKERLGSLNGLHRRRSIAIGLEQAGSLVGSLQRPRRGHGDDLIVKARGAISKEAEPRISDDAHHAIVRGDQRGDAA